MSAMAPDWGDWASTCESRRQPGASEAPAAVVITAQVMGRTVWTAVAGEGRRPAATVVSLVDRRRS